MKIIKRTQIDIKRSKEKNNIDEIMKKEIASNNFKNENIIIIIIKTF